MSSPTRIWCRTGLHSLNTLPDIFFVCGILFNVFAVVIHISPAISHCVKTGKGLTKNCSFLQILYVGKNIKIGVVKRMNHKVCLAFCFPIFPFFLLFLRVFSSALSILSFTLFFWPRYVVCVFTCQPPLFIYFLFVSNFSVFSN